MRRCTIVNTALFGSTRAQILGIDASPAMIEQPRANYPALRFEVADALQFQTPHLFDAVFSNAVLHWITEPGRMIDRVFQWLKPGGRFVGEFGGQGNIRLIVGALEHALARAGMTFPEHLDLWYFPSAEEYAGLLERRGFQVRSITLFDRPTPLDGGERGLQTWMNMFANWFFCGLTPEQQEAILTEMEQELRPSLYRAGTWFADYRATPILSPTRLKNELPFPGS